MHDLIKSLFWLQVDSDFTLKLKWVCSVDNKDADNLTRPGTVEHVRLEQRCFDHLWEEWGGFDMDLMARPYNGYRAGARTETGRCHFNHDATPTVQRALMYSAKTPSATCYA